MDDANRPKEGSEEGQQMSMSHGKGSLVEIEGELDSKEVVGCEGA